MKDPAKIRNYKAVQYSRALFPVLLIPTVEKSRPPSSGTIMPPWRLYSTVLVSFFRTGWYPRLWAAMYQVLLSPTAHSFWSCKFSLTKNMLFMLCLMSKGTLMVRTSVWMLQFMPVNVQCRVTDANTQQSELTQSSSVAHTSESGMSQAVKSSGKHRKLYCFGS